MHTRNGFRFVAAPLVAVLVACNSSAAVAPPPASEKEACAAGDDAACARYGHALLAGDLEANAKTAVAVLAHPCEKGAAAACDDFGIALFTDKQPARARPLLETACKTKRSHVACYQLGSLEKDTARAYDYDVQGCELGNLGSCVRKAEALEAGKVTKKDLAEAERLYEKTCAAGYFGSCFSLGWLVEKKDPKRAAELWRKACDAKLPYGCGALGYAYVEGIGVTKDRDQARKLLARGCEGKYAPACDDLATLDKPKARAAAAAPAAAQCSGALYSCGGSCVDIKSNFYHCGQCNWPCSGNAVACDRGFCVDHNGVTIAH
jgi:TPR repeat protein